MDVYTTWQASDQEMHHEWYKEVEEGFPVTLFRACLPSEVLGHVSEHGYVYPEYGGIFTTVSYQESRDWLKPWFDDEIEGRKIHILNFVPKKPLFLHKDRHLVVRALLEQVDDYTEEDIQRQFDVLGQGVIAETSYLAFQYLWEVWGYDCVILTNEGGELSRTEPWVLIMDIGSVKVVGVVDDATPRDDEERLNWSDDMDHEEEEAMNQHDGKVTFDELARKADEKFVGLTNVDMGEEPYKRDHIIHVTLWTGMLFGDTLQTKYVATGATREDVICAIAREAMTDLYETVQWYNGEGDDEEAAESYLETYADLQQLVEDKNLDAICVLLEDYYEHSILYTYKIVTPVMTMWGSDMAPIGFEEGTTVEVVVHKDKRQNATDIKAMMSKMDEEKFDVMVACISPEPKF